MQYDYFENYLKKSDIIPEILFRGNTLLQSKLKFIEEYERTNNRIIVVSGSFNPAFFNSEKIIGLLKDGINKGLEIVVVGGPKVLVDNVQANVDKGDSRTAADESRNEIFIDGLSNKILELSSYIGKENFRFYKSRIRYNFHYWIFDDTTYFEEPHKEASYARSEYVIRDNKAVCEFLIQDMKELVRDEYLIPVKDIRSDFEFAYLRTELFNAEMDLLSDLEESINRLSNYPKDEMPPELGKSHLLTGQPLEEFLDSIQQI